MKNGTTRVHCKCRHEYQDKTLGIGVRVANTTKKQDKDFVEVRCTICKSIHRVNPGAIR